MITIYAKATNRCNVGCTHCYLPEAVRANSARMRPETVDAMGRFAADMERRARHDRTHVIWHGGEPLVVPPSFYETAGERLDRILPNHTESIQTSLVPFREEFVPLVHRRFGSLVGSSVDFSQRMLNGSVAAYHDLWMRKVELARANGITVIPGFVPTRNEIGKEAEVVGWFAERGFDHFSVERYNAYSLAFPDRPSNREHSGILIGLFESVLDRLLSGAGAPSIGVVRAGIGGVIDGRPGDRWGGSCMSDFVVVEPDGSLNNCPDKSTVEEAYGNVHEGYASFAMNRFRRKSIRHQQVDHKQSWCQGCENLHFCGSGCPITPNGSAEDPAETECSGYRTFLSHVRRRASEPGIAQALRGYLAGTASPSQASFPEGTSCAA